MEIVERTASQLQELQACAEALGRETGFIRRRRKLTGASFALTLVLGYLAEPCASLSLLAGVAAGLGVRITPQGLAARLGPEAAEFLRRLLEAMVQRRLWSEQAPTELLARFQGVWIGDSSVVSLPASLAGVWPGCQGAALKLFVVWDLLRGELQGPILAPGRQGDRSHGPPASLPVGALWLADLGYFSLQTLAALTARGVFFLSRVPACHVVHLADGRRLSLGQLLQESGDRLDLPLRLGDRKLPGRLLALQVPAAVAAQRRGRLTQEAQRRGRAVNPSSWQLAAWTVLITNVPAPQLSLAEALTLLRARWQLELLFKLWKSDLQVDTFTTAQPEALLCQLYARLLAALVAHWLLLETWSEPTRSLVRATRRLQLFVVSLGSILTAGDRESLVAWLTALGPILSSACRLSKRRRPSAAALLLAPDRVLALT